MNIDFLRRAQCPTLELFFAGWGMDSRPFVWAADSPHTAHCDFAVCYDTLENLSAESVDRFNRRMCGAHRAVFEARRPVRTVDSLLTELRHIRECAARTDRAQFTDWNMAVLSKKDRIFPIANMRKAWSAIPVLELDEPHYMPDIPFVPVELP